MLDNPLALINIIRMIGILPLQKNNFYINNDSPHKLSTFIMKKVSEQLVPIFETMDAMKWILFEKCFYRTFN